MPTKQKASSQPRKRKPKAGADKRERLKPVSLHPLEFDEVMRRLVTGSRKISGGP